MIYKIYQIIDHPTLIKKLKWVCELELNDSEIEKMKKLRDLGNNLFELTNESVDGLNNRIIALAVSTGIKAGHSFAIDLKKSSNE